VRGKFAIVSLVIVIGLMLWLFWPGPAYDPERVHPRLRALQQPYQSVKAVYYMDGGSIGIEIVDRGSSREQFALPHHLGDTNRYTKVFVGALYDRKHGAEEISDPEHTKRMLIEILRKTPNRHAWADFCLMSLRHRPIDFVTCLFHKWKGRYD